VSLHGVVDCWALPDHPPDGGFTPQQLNQMSSVYTSPLSVESVSSEVVNFDPDSYKERPGDVPVQMKTTMVSARCVDLRTMLGFCPLKCKAMKGINVWGASECQCVCDCAIMVVFSSYWQSLGEVYYIMRTVSVSIVSSSVSDVPRYQAPF
jgi:hypothetical protein